MCTSDFRSIASTFSLCKTLGGVCTRNNLHHARETICIFSMKLHLHSVIMSCCSLHVVRNRLHVQLFNFNGRHHGYLHICDVLLHPAVFAARAVHITSHLPAYSFWSLILCSRSTCASRFYLFTKFLCSCKVSVVLAGSLVIAGLFVQGRPRKHHQIRILKFHSKTSVINDPPFIASATGTFMHLHQRVCLCLCLYLLVLLS